MRRAPERPGAPTGPHGCRFQIENLKSAVCKADQDSQRESCLALWTLLTPSGKGLRPFEPGAEWRPGIVRRSWGCTLCALGRCAPALGIGLPGLPGRPQGSPLHEVSSPPFPRNPNPGDQRGRSPFATEGVMGFQGELGDQLGSPGPLGPRRVGESPSAGLRKFGVFTPHPALSRHLPLKGKAWGDAGAHAGAPLRKMASAGCGHPALQIVCELQGGLILKNTVLSDGVFLMPCGLFSRWLCRRARPVRPRQCRSARRRSHPWDNARPHTGG